MLRTSIIVTADIWALTECSFIIMFKLREVNGEVFGTKSGECSSLDRRRLAKLISQNSFFNYDRVFYFHPDIAEAQPVDWSDIGKPPAQRKSFTLLS